MTPGSRQASVVKTNMIVLVFLNFRSQQNYIYLTILIKMFVARMENTLLTGGSGDKKKEGKFEHNVNILAEKEHIKGKH